MTLRRRVFLAVLPLVLLLLLLGGTGGWLLFNLGRRSDAILRENYDSIRAMVLLSDAADRMEQAATSNWQDDYDAARADFYSQLTVERNNVTIFPDEPRLVAELETAVSEWDAAGKALFQSPIAERAAKLGELRSRLQTVKAAAAAILRLNQDQMEAENRSTQRTARWSMIGFGLGLLAAVGLAAYFTYRLISLIGAPVQALTAGVRAIRAGDLTHRVPESRRDELGELATAFNDMAEQLWLVKQTNFRQLARARETAQATIDSFPSPVLVLDPEGQLELANPTAKRLFGLIVGPNKHQAPWRPPDSLREPVLQALRDQRPALTDRFDQAVTLRIDGTDRFYLPQVRPIRSDQGDTLGVAIVLDDVTQFRLMDQLKGDFVATASHELKTPLTGLRMAVHLLLEETVGPLTAKQTELLIDARDNAERLFATIEHLLALARLEDRQEALALERCEVGDLFRRAVDDVAVRAGDKPVSVHVENATGLPPLAADPVRLGQALNNLLINAVAYTPPGGTITLSASQFDDRVRLTVADTGVGIPAEYLPHVFDKFFRVPDDAKPPGTGLGLAIVKEVVTAHGGEVACESEVGLGTRFHLTLPVWKGGDA